MICSLQVVLVNKRLFKKYEFVEVIWAVIVTKHEIPRSRRNEARLKSIFILLQNSRDKIDHWEYQNCVSGWKKAHFDHVNLSSSRDSEGWSSRMHQCEDLLCCPDWMGWSSKMHQREDLLCYYDTIRKIIYKRSLTDQYPLRECRAASSQKSTRAKHI